MSSAHLPMINIARVSDWLTSNTNEHVYPRLFLMSPNGTLLAYSKPVQTKELRDQAALISMTWKDHCQGRQKLSLRNGNTQDQALKPALKTLTIETPDCNIIVRLLQPELLLVLIGRIAPGKKQAFKISAEGQGDPRYPEADAPESRPSSRSQLLPVNAATDSSGAEDRLTTKNKAPSLLSNMSQRDRDIRSGALHVQRKQLDRLAEYALQDFAQTGFIMPADADLHTFPNRRLTVADEGVDFSDNATRLPREVRQASINAGDSDLTLLVEILVSSHEENGDPEPMTAAPSDPEDPHDGSYDADYEDPGQNEVDPGSNTASSEIEIPSDDHERPSLPHRSLTQTRIPIPIVQRGLIRVQCYLKAQPAPSIAKIMTLGQFRPQCPRRAEMARIWRNLFDVKRRQAQMRQA
ncbi:hypothetical protein G6011_06044 [Alternaria panax]|uniref:Uncharacterized protein n=1 Tax=Alternaria panax TaxID=48097 RepID=A0AAD4I982_9PLEO|nr:hypothetical protein G6011_06044 [Alternaria panax]